MNCLNLACGHSWSDHLPVCIRCPCERFAFPELKAPVAHSSGACAVDVMRSIIDRAENDPNCPESMVRLAPFMRKVLDAVTIPEVETVQ
jgi:hypothetical protein